VAAAGTVEIRAGGWGTPSWPTRAMKSCSGCAAWSWMPHRFGRMGSRPYGDAIKSEEGIRVPPVRHALRSPEAVGRERNGSPRPPGRHASSRACWWSVCRFVTPLGRGTSQVVHAGGRCAVRHAYPARPPIWSGPA